MAGLSSHEELIMLRKRARRRLVGAIALVLMSTTVLWNVLGHIPNTPMRPEKVEIASNLAKPVPPPAAPPAQAAAAGAPASAPAAKGRPATELVASLPPEAVPLVPSTPPKPAEPAVVQKAVEAPKAAEPASKAEAPAVRPEPRPEPKPEPKPDKRAHAEAKVEPKKPEAKPKPEPKPEAKPAEKAHKDPAAILEGRADAAPKAEKPAADKPKSGNGFAIQLAALSDPAKADALKSRLAAAGVAAHFSKVTTSKGEVTRVRVGPFASREEADATLKKLARAGVTGIVVPR